MSPTGRKPPFYILKPDHGTPATDLIAAHRDARLLDAQRRAVSAPEPPKPPASFADFQAGFHSPSRG